MSHDYLPNYILPEEFTRPNPRALDRLREYYSWIRGNPATPESLGNLFLLVNQETMNYDPLCLDGLMWYIGAIMEQGKKDRFFGVILPNLLEAAISYPKECEDIRLLRKSTNTKVRLSRKAIFSIVANSFFCTYNDAKRESVNIQNLPLI